MDSVHRLWDHVIGKAWILRLGVVFMGFGKKKAPVIELMSYMVSYKGGSIKIKSPDVDYRSDDGEFVRDTAQHLEFIEAIPGVGKIVDDLSTQGNEVRIQYARDAGINYVRGGREGLYKLCFVYFDRGPDRNDETRGPEGLTPFKAFGEELKRALTRGGYHTPDFADRLLRENLYSWNDGAKEEHPFKAGGVMMTKAQITEKIDEWLSGKMIPPIKQFDLVSKTLEMFLRPGDGGGTTISYDPLYDVGRPAHVGLYHELVHAYYYATGTQLGIEDSSRSDNGGRHFELMSTGFVPHRQKPYSENKYRASLNPSVAARTTYP